MLKKLIDDKNIPDEIFNIIYEYLDITQLKCKHINFIDEFHRFWRHNPFTTGGRLNHTNLGFRNRSWYDEYSNNRWFPTCANNCGDIPYQGDARLFQLTMFDEYINDRVYPVGSNKKYNQFLYNLQLLEFTNCIDLKKELKKYKVKGRSKLKTKEEMIQALMKL